MAVVAQRYSLVRPLGGGPTGKVYVARVRADGSYVALKLVSPLRAPEGDLEARVSSRVSEVARIDHPGVVGPLDTGYDPDQGAGYVAMPLLHGRSYRDRVRHGGASSSELVDFLARALLPLAKAHSIGIAHGALRPHNLFAEHARDGDEVLRLLDFALPFDLASPDVHAPYWAPERLAGGPPSLAADVWGFGVLLFLGLTGALPFEGANAAALAGAIRAGAAPRRAVDVVSDVNEGLSQLVDLCLKKDPEARPPDARALMRMLQTLRSLSDAPRGHGPGQRVDTLLDRTGAAPSPPPEPLEVALRDRPRDPAVHRALLDFYRAEGSRDGIWLAACALAHLGAASSEEVDLTHHFRKAGGLLHDRGFDPSSWASVLHPDQDPRIDALWAELPFALTAARAASEAPDPLKNAVSVDFARPRCDLSKSFRGALGTIRPAVMPRLFRGRVAESPKFVPGHPPASVFPRGFEDPLPPSALAFAVARHVAYYRDAHLVCTLLQTPEQLEEVFRAAFEIGLAHSPSPSVSPAWPSLDPYLDEDRRRRLRTACAHLRDVATRVDLGTWRRSVEMSCARVGLVVSEDLEGAVWMTRWTRERRRVPLDDAIDDLLRFWSSGAHQRVRYILGLSVDAG